jgi:hypothetical protein
MTRAPSKLAIPNYNEIALQRFPRTQCAIDASNEIERALERPSAARADTDGYESLSAEKRLSYRWSSLDRSAQTV